MCLHGLLSVFYIYLHIFSRSCHIVTHFTVLPLNHILHCIQAIHKQFTNRFKQILVEKKNGLKTKNCLQIWQLCDHHHNMTQASSESHLFYSIRHHIFAKEPWISVPMHRTYQSLYSTTNKTIQQIFELCCLFCSSSCHQWQSKLLHSLFTLVSSTLKNKPDV